MTCEIAVANRLGVALAADSAVTFTKQTNDGRRTSTYSSGANKILQPLKREPVALMVYDNAELGEMPWELVVKQFRSLDGDDSEEFVSGYMGRLIKFINGSEELFPMEWRNHQTQRLYGVGLIRLVHTLRQRFPIVADANASFGAKLAAGAQLALDLEADLDAAPIADGLVEADYLSALSGHAVELVAEVGDAIQANAPDLANVLDAATYLRLAIKLAFKWPWEVTGTPSGIVIAGYGASEVLPSFVEHAFMGFVGTSICSVERAAKSVPRGGVGAVIEAFARKAMVETFTQGVSPEAWVQAETEFRVRADELFGLAVAESGPAAIQPTDARREQLVAAATDQFKQRWADASLEAHWRPLLEVVASLPVDQLAELAENLVMLESLKERVTRRTQSVGGPIDVAVITKAEGLIWIKRKHFFRPDLNQRYFARFSDGG